MRPYQISYLSPSSQNEFLEIPGNNVRSKVIKEIKKSKLYSASADTTPDVSHKDQMNTSFSYVDKTGEPRERILS